MKKSSIRCTYDKLSLKLSLVWLTAASPIPAVLFSAAPLRNVQICSFPHNCHEDGKLMVETVPVLDFVSRLIRHIPEKHFKMIRYYGLYAKHHPPRRSICFIPFLLKSTRTINL